MQWLLSFSSVCVTEIYWLECEVFFFFIHAIECDESSRIWSHLNIRLLNILRLFLVRCGHYQLHYVWSTWTNNTSCPFRLSLFSHFRPFPWSPDVTQMVCDLPILNYSTRERTFDQIKYESNCNWINDEQQIHLIACEKLRDQLELDTSSPAIFQKAYYFKRR